MPETRPIHPNSDDTQHRRRSDDPRQPGDAGSRPPPPSQDLREQDLREQDLREGGAVDGDEPEYNGRDWRDNQGGRGAPPLPDDDRDRRRSDDGETARPLPVRAGSATTFGRSGSWGPVLSGAATAFVVFLSFSALWVALTASGVEAIGDNLAWFQLVSGGLAAAAGGAAAGWLDPRGAMTGMIQGCATWGLLILAVIVAGLTTGTALLGGVGDVPLDADIEAANLTEMLQPFQAELWALFAVLLGGALIAASAGALTGRAHAKRTLDARDHHDDQAHDRGRVADEHRATR